MREYFEATRSAGVLRLQRPGTHWLSTGWNGGFSRAPVAYNCTVPEGWDPEDVGSDVEQRLARADFDAAGPVLLTGVDQRHARGGRAGPVAAVATVGLSNPATLSRDPTGATTANASAGPPGPGTVNLFVGTTRSLPPSAMANLVAVVAEARTATLLGLTDFTGTTSDAVVVACDPDGERAQYTGSATTVGRAARACVREALTASFHARYDEREPPSSVADADHGVATTQRAEVFEP